MLIMMEEKKKEIGRMSSIFCCEWAYYKIRLIISIFKKWFGRVNNVFIMNENL
jgi:hypothetical protein